MTSLIIENAKLLSVAVRLLEVIADDLLVLGEPVARDALDPAREPLMEARPVLL